MRKIVIFFFALIYLISFSGTDSQAGVKKGQTSRKGLADQEKAGSAKKAGKAGSAEPGDNYMSAILVEAGSGMVLFDKEAEKAWPPASMTKMMVMLIAAEKMKEGAIKVSDTVKTSLFASKMGGSQVWLKEGEELSFEELMKAMIIASANDATVAIAEKLSGNADDFINLMNERASQIGMKNTLFNSVHGLPPGQGQEGDLSTAADMAILARELVKHPEILKWCALATDEFRGGTLILRNINKLIGSYPGADGLKTGHIKESGFNVTGTAQRGELRLIVVIMGAETNKDRFNQAAKLLNYGFANYTRTLAAKADTPVGPAIKIKNSETRTIQAVPISDISLILKKQEARSLKQEFQLPDSVSAPVKKGQELGTLILKTGGVGGKEGKEVAKITLVSPKEVPKASFFWRLFH